MEPGSPVFIVIENNSLGHGRHIATHIRSRPRPFYHLSGIQDQVFLVMVTGTNYSAQGSQLSHWVKIITNGVSTPEMIGPV
jgi:hypothetical protein